MTGGRFARARRPAAGPLRPLPGWAGWGPAPPALGFSPRPPPAARRGGSLFCTRCWGTSSPTLAGTWRGSAEAPAEPRSRSGAAGTLSTETELALSESRRAGTGGAQRTGGSMDHHRSERSPPNAPRMRKEREKPPPKPPHSGYICLIFLFLFFNPSIKALTGSGHGAPRLPPPRSPLWSIAMPARTQPVGPRRGAACRVGGRRGTRTPSTRRPRCVAPRPPRAAAPRSIRQGRAARGGEAARGGAPARALHANERRRESCAN